MKVEYTHIENIKFIIENAKIYNFLIGESLLKKQRYWFKTKTIYSNKPLKLGFFNIDLKLELL